MGTTTTLSERVQWVVTECGFGNARALSVAAGLSPAHVGMIIRGDVKGRITAATLAKIAAAGEVDPGWLTTGEGSPRHVEVTPTPATATWTASRPEVTLTPTGDTETPLERAVAEFVSDRRFRMADVDAAREAVRRAMHLQAQHADVAALARAYVEAAAWVREAGLPVTPENVAHRAAIARSTASPEAISAASADDNERARREYEALINPKG